MKTYTETINKLAQQAFNNYMQGSYAPMQDCNTSLVAFVYERDEKEVAAAVELVFKHKQDAHYEAIRG